MNIFKRLAKFVVTAYAKLIFNQAMYNADVRYRKERVMIYVVEDMFHPGRLTTYDRGRFKTEKRIIGTSARLLTLETMKQRCYYHTPDTAGNQKMTNREIDRRRLAFIRERLIKARLV